MTDTKEAKTNKSNKESDTRHPPRRSFVDRSSGVLHLDESVLDPSRAYRWAILNDKHGRDDYGICYEMGYRDTLQSTLKGRIRSDSDEKIIRQSNSGTFVLMDAPKEYRQMTNDEIAQKTEDDLKQKMGARGEYKQVGNELHVKN